jgi:hypothetical protein
VAHSQNVGGNAGTELVIKEGEMVTEDYTYYNSATLMQVNYTHRKLQKKFYLPAALWIHHGHSHS